MNIMKRVLLLPKQRLILNFSIALLQKISLPPRDQSLMTRSSPVISPGVPLSETPSCEGRDPRVAA